MKHYKIRNQKSGSRTRIVIDKLKIVCFFLFFASLFTHCPLSSSYADDSPLNRLRNEVISYLKPVTGKITTVEDGKVVVDLGTKDALKKGMRFNVLREGSPFIHPITKEFLGRLESSVGSLEIKEVGPDSSTAVILSGDARAGDKIRISGTKINLLFCQSRDIDWHIADSYYRSLKETGRFNMIDTGLETEEPSKAIEEAKRLNAEIILILTVKEVDSGKLITQRLFWVLDGSRFSEMDTKVDITYEKELRFGEELFTRPKGETWLQFDLPASMRLVSTGDIDGDGRQEIVLSTGKDIKVYTFGADLQPALGETEIKGSVLDDNLWIEAIDLNRNGRDEIIITAKRGDDVISYIYELRGTEFILLYKDNVFLRKIENGLIAQAYSSMEGFDGDIFKIVWDGEYRRGERIRLPKGVNIYDFQFIEDPQRGRLIFAYDDEGFLNLYDERDVKIWRSKTYTGGFLSTFKKKALSTIVEKGEWAIKDRLFLRNREIFIVKRIPLLEMAKGLGYKNSQIRNLWWNGFSMEEDVLIDDIRGSILDYVVAGEKIIILASPMFGIKAGNILKGENPLKTILYVYSIKGR
ncbi:MAG: VCBS repeat-containing protein [Nitrospirota bacterium]